MNGGSRFLLLKKSKKSAKKWCKTVDKWWCGGVTYTCKTVEGNPKRNTQTTVVAKLTKKKHKIRRLRMNLVLSGKIKDVAKQVFDLVAYYGENAKVVDVVEYERTL